MAGETEGEEAEILGDGEGPLTLIKLQRQSAKPRTSKSARGPPIKILWKVVPYA